MPTAESFFDNRKDYITYLIMKCIEQSKGAVGSWALRENLLENGVDCSTATVGRYLKDLDYKEYTFPCGNQGRILTPLGKAQIATLDLSINRYEVQSKLAREVQVNSYEELIDLINTRKALEMEACAQACVRATENDLKLLKKALSDHQACVDNNEDPTDTAFNFHEVIGQICHNKFLYAMLDMLFFEEKKMESRFETLVTRERGKSYVKEHWQITEAIAARDSWKAAQLMSKHIDVLRYAVEEDWDRQLKQNGKQR